MTTTFLQLGATQIELSLCNKNLVYFSKRKQSDLQLWLFTSPYKSWLISSSSSHFLVNQWQHSIRLCKSFCFVLFRVPSFSGAVILIFSNSVTYILGWCITGKVDTSFSILKSVELENEEDDNKTLRTVFLEFWVFGSLRNLIKCFRNRIKKLRFFNHF